jgi:two-component system OmpR family response regulator
MKILVIEDDPQTADFIARGLRESGHVVDTSGDGRQGLLLAMQHDYDALVVDRMLPGLDGLAVVRALRAAERPLPALILSALGEVDDRVAGLRAGGDDYLVKPFDGQELVARVHALLRRTGRDSSGTWQVGDLLVDRGRREVSRRGQSIALTKLEFDLLDLLGGHPGRVWEKDVLAGQLWGSDVYDLNLVEVHISQLRRKLEAHGQRLIHTIRGVGYVMRVPPAT